MKNKAFFLDRDGVINVEADYLHEPEQVELIPGTAAALRRLHAGGYLAVVTTNQSGVARGMFDLAAVHAVHDRIQELLADDGEQLDAFYICCHHPQYTGSCDCRKPAPGLILRAAAELDIDPASSYMVGDRLSDLEAGRRAGCRASYLVKTGYGAAEAERAAAAGFPVAADLAAAVDAVLQTPGEL